MAPKTLAVVSKSLALLVLALLVAGCERRSSSLDATRIGPTAPASSVSAMSIERPHHAMFEFRVYDVTFAPPGTLSTFDGRCSVPSAFVVFATIAGQATHLGRFEGTASHCNQPGAAPGVIATYRDGLVSLVGANGEALSATYGLGTIRPDPDVPGRLLFEDSFTLTGGTGRFEGASGGGTDRGALDGDVSAVLAGAPVRFEQAGTITYAPGRGGQ